MQTDPAPSAPATRQPKVVFTVIDRENGRSFWTRIGSAWVNRDGSLTIRLDALPVNGVLQVRDPDDRDRDRDRASNGNGNGNGGAR